MAANTVVLITGANRGIGKGLVTSYLAKPNTTVIAAVRSPNDETSKSLLDLPTASESKLIFEKIDATSVEDHKAAVQDLKTTHNINHVDILISNAGILPPSSVAPVLQASPSEMRSIFEVNTIGPLILLQTFFELLEKAEKPRFFVISSALGSIGFLPTYKVPFFAYGITKSAVNYLVVKASTENENVISIAFDPGWVKTEMGNNSANAIGMAEAPTTLEECVNGLMGQFDSVTKESSGKFLSYNGTITPW